MLLRILRSKRDISVRPTQSRRAVIGTHQHSHFALLAVGEFIIGSRLIVGSFSLQKKQQNATSVAILASYKIGRQNISSAR